MTFKKESDLQKETQPLRNVKEPFKRKTTLKRSMTFKKRKMTYTNPTQWSALITHELLQDQQRYVGVMFESPANMDIDRTSLKTLSKFFNWSFSYRQDSTFYRPYGRFIQVPGAGSLDILSLTSDVLKTRQDHLCLKSQQTHF